MKSKNDQGFTLLELMIITTIVGILAGASMYSIAHFIKEKRSEQHVMALWTELSSLRARAMKDNCPYIVTLTNNASGMDQYTVYKNTKEDYSIASTSSSVVQTSMTASGKIEYGFGTPTPTAGLTAALAGAAYGTSSSIQGQWVTFDHDKNNTTAALTNQIVFEANDIGSISEGALFIKNSSVKKTGYAIVKAANSNTLKLYKWDGSKWYKL